MAETPVVIALLVGVAFVCGWAFHRWQTYWAIVRVRGEMEQWVEEQCGHLIGLQTCEEMDAILNGGLAWAWPATLTWWFLSHGYWAHRRYKRRTVLSELQDNHLNRNDP